MYTITITKKVENPAYVEQMKQFNASARYSNAYSEPEKHLVEKQLEVTLKDEEFEAVKKAVLEMM